ncbi:unnamed protein product [Chironomus riparius]|uniref:Uncharacterized protein n=1 Tax=Chironomus riparius TaxID=315576 RepID=A0A9P0INV2_9DIPT|nr:unnamed protein product [Chironomus riparius]
MVSIRNVFLVSMLVIIGNYQCECGVFSLVRDILQWNVAGLPLIHQKTEWDFDPEVAQKRREQFYEIHGYRAAKYLERIGQGIDGRHREREHEQAIRDDGHLQGVNLLQP